MGVTGLWKLIEPCGKPVPVETLEGKVLAVDISIWLHQAVKGFQDNKGSALPNAHLLGLFHRLCKLLYYRVKPIFVFDGCVPQLKRETIARRQQQRSKLNTEAERIQALLLQSLAKEKVVQQALGANAELLLKSPSKRITTRTDNVDEMFKLPELPAATKKQNEEDSMDNNDASLTSLNSNDESASSTADDSSSFDESNARHSYNANLQAIDVKSQHFLNLPADVRHEILVDIKDTRKQSSWGRLHELPAKSDDFSEFQMKRLLKRRAVQESLEEAEQEMGGRTLTYAELSNLFTEEGILEEKNLEKGAKPICSDEHTRFLLVRDLKKKLCKTEKIDSEVKKTDSGRDLKEESEITPKIAKEAQVIEESQEDEELGKEFDTELELALAMSLENTQVYSQSDYNFDSNEELKLNRNQRKRLQNAAIGPARAYMIEYGGMNDEEVEKMIEKTQLEDTLTMIDNDDIVVEKDILDTVEKFNTTSESQEIRLRVSDTETESDSDFEEVTVENENKSTTNEVPKPLEIVVELKDNFPDDDDLFADVFIAETEETESFLGSQDKTEIEALKPRSQDIITIPDSEELMPVDVEETSKNLSKELKLENNSTMTINSKSILSDLKSQLDEIKNINLDDIKVDDTNIIEVSDDEIPKKVILSSSIPKTPVKTEIVEIRDSDDDAFPSTSLNSKSPKLKTPTKNRSILEYFPADYIVKRTPEKPNQTEEDDNVPKVASPFFVNRTPKSNRKRSATKDSSASNSPLKKSTSKATKILFEEESNDKVVNAEEETDSLGVEPIKLTPINTEDLINEAAQKLKEQKTEEELKTIASNLAKERRDLENERNRQDRMSMPISQRMSAECQELLKLFGIPYIVAPMEAEAQCAFLDSIELTNGTITDDSDIWLFGGRVVYKNFFAQNKHVLEFRAEKIENSFNCDRKKLIQLACLVGSDYTTGINGIGAVTALEILASFAPPITSPTKATKATTTAIANLQNSNENMREIINTVLQTLNKFRDWWLLHKTSAAPIGSSTRLALKKKLKNIELHEGFPSLAVVEAYLTPTVDDNREAFSWGYPDVESIKEYAKKTFGWTIAKTNEILIPVIKRLDEKKSQATIRNYFSVKSAISTPQLKVSKRVQKAIEQMSGLIDADNSTTEKPKSKAPPKKRAIRGKKKQNTENCTTTTTVTETTNVDDVMEIDVPESKVDVAEEQPTTSQQAANRMTRKRAAIDLHSKKSDLIPQREKDKAKMLENKTKAAEILNKQKEKATAKKKRTL